MIQILQKIEYHDELIEILFRNKLGVLATNFATPLIIAYILNDIFTLWQLLIYVFFIFSLGYIRLIISKKGLIAIDKKDKKGVEFYLKQILINIFISALLTGISSYFCIIYGTSAEVSFYMALIFILLAGSISTIISVYHAYILFNLPILILLTLSLLLADNQYYIITASILVLYSIVVLPSSFRIFQSLKNNIEKNILIKKQQKQLIENQSQLLQSEKMAALGEMIGNIAHQWRQPLSSISTLATGSIVQKEFNRLSDIEFEKNMNTINEQVQYLSETIDTFRNFLKDQKEYREIDIQENITIAINIVKATLKDNYIDFKFYSLLETKIVKSMVVGELPQVIINIINNAKDVLLERNIDNPEIVLELYCDEKNIFISIEDNGGGVPDDIILKIFEPYFTTKHKSKGTGLGLHMCYKIVTESLGGTISVQNTLKGAKFTINLPL